MSPTAAHLLNTDVVPFSEDHGMPIKTMLSETIVADVNRPGFIGGSNCWEGGAMTSKTTNKFSPEARGRAARLRMPTVPTPNQPWRRDSNETASGESGGGSALLLR